MMDEDEDVIFENSALHQHLKDAGLSDEYVETERKVQASSACNLIKTDAVGSTDRKQNKWFYSRLKQNFMDFVFDDVWCREIKSLGRKHAAKVVEECVKCSEGLVEEDLAFVESYTSSVRWDAYEDESEDSPLRSDDSIVNQMLTQVGILGVTIAYGFFRMFYVKSAEVSTYLFIYALDVLSVLLTTIALAPATLKFALAGRLVSRLDARSVAVTKFLSQIQREQRLFSKTVLFVREAELMKRGFTLMKSSTIQLESSSGERQCPDLRRALFSRAKNSFLTFRSATETLLSKNSSLLDCELSDGEYLASMPLERFGPCVILQESERKELEKETDNYCLTAIQGIIELMDVQISEFIRILCVLCLTQAECLHRLPVRDFHSYCDVIGSVADEVAADSKVLEKAFILNKTFVIKLEELSAKDLERQPVIKQSPGKTMHTAVHSLMLHLHAAVSRLQSIDTELEKLVDAGGEDTPCREFLENIESVLQNVRREIVASRDCCDEADSRVKKLLHPQEDGQSSAEDHQQDSAGDMRVNRNVKPSYPVLVIPQCNPVVEDEVFEGFTNEKSNHVDDSSYMFTDEKRSRRDKAEVMRLLTELQSVISARAADTKEREARALARQAGKPAEQRDGGSEEPLGAELELSDLQCGSKVSIRPTSTENSTGDSTSTAGIDSNSTRDSTSTAGIESNSTGYSTSNVGIDSNSTGTTEGSYQQSSFVSNKEAPSLKSNESEDRNPRMLASQEIIDSHGQSWHVNKEENVADTQPHDLSDNENIDSESSRKPTNAVGDCANNYSCGENSFVGFGGGMFTSAIAQLAVNRSKQMPSMCVETFGDGSDTESDNSGSEIDN